MLMLGICIATISYEIYFLRPSYDLENAIHYLVISITGIILIGFTEFAIRNYKKLLLNKAHVLNFSAILSGLCWLSTVLASENHWGDLHEPKEIVVIGLFLQVLAWNKSRIAMLLGLTPLILWELSLLLDKDESHLIRYASIMAVFYFATNGLYKKTEELLVDKTVENKELKNISYRDTLTGAYNRRGYDKRIRKLIKESEGMPFVLAIIDIDFFKQYNDTYGHLKGDECLTTVVQVLKASFRRSADIVARIGGEEFAVLLPNTTKDQARNLLAHAQSNLCKANIPHRASTVSHYVTVSCGFAEFNFEESEEELFKRADKLLYEAKRMGRNQVL